MAKCAITKDDGLGTSRGGRLKESQSSTAGTSKRSVTSGRVGNKDVGEGTSRGGTSPMGLRKNKEEKIGQLKMVERMIVNM